MLVPVAPNEVPAFLRTSAFFQALSDENPNDLIQVPVRCIKANDNVNSLEDFALLLRVIIYWVVPDIPHSLIQFCDAINFSTWRSTFEENVPDNVLLKDDLRFIFDDANGNPDPPIVRAMKIGRRDVFEYFARSAGPQSRNDPSIAATAAGLGRVDFLISLRSHGFFWNAGTSKAAAASGHLQCLIYARENGCPWPENLSTVAAEHGQLECLSYIHENGGAWTEATCVAAAANGHDHCLEYLNINECPWDEKVTLEAARGGHVRCLEYAIVNWCPVHPDAASTAAAYGHLDCLRMMWEYGQPHQVMRRQYPLMSQEELKAKTKQNHIPRELIFNESVITEAVAHDHVEVVHAALWVGCPYAEDLVKLAAEGGSLDLLRYLIENEGMYMNEDGSVFLAALRRANLPCMQYLIDVDCPFQSTAAASDAHFPSPLPPEYDARLAECMEFAVYRGWRPDDATIQFVNDRELVGCQEFLRDFRHSFGPVDPPIRTPTLALVGCTVHSYLYFFLKFVAAICCFFSMRMFRCEGEESARENKELQVNNKEEHTATAPGVELVDEMQVEDAPPPLPVPHKQEEAQVHFSDVEENQAEVVMLPAPQPSVTEVLLPSAFDVLYARYEQGEVFEAPDMAAAAEGGHLDCMQLLYKLGCPWDETTTNAAALSGQADTLHFAMRHGCPHSPRVVELAAWSGVVHCVVYLIEHCRCVCQRETGAEFRAALVGANFECLSYLIDNGYPISNYSFDALLDRELYSPTGKSEELLACLIYAVGSGWQWNDCFVEYLHVQGFVQCVDYLNAIANPSPEYTVPCACHCDRSAYINDFHHAWVMAGFAGCITCMRELHKHYAPVNAAIMSAAAAGGNLNCVAYLHEHGCEWDARTTSAAARHGHIGILQYTVNSGCDYTSEVVELAAGALNYSLICLTYVIESLSCSVENSRSVLGAALMRADVECVRYLLESGVCGPDSVHNVVEFISARARISRRQDPDLLHCIELCVQYGWGVNSDIVYFVSLNLFMLCFDYFEQS